MNTQITLRVFTDTFKTKEVQNSVYKPVKTKKIARAYTNLDMNDVAYERTIQRYVHSWSNQKLYANHIRRHGG